MMILAYLCNWLELLGLAVLMGGMITLGVLVTPTVFVLLPPVSTGGELMSTLFMRFNSIVAYICFGMILIGFSGKLALKKTDRKRKFLEGILLSVMLSAGVYVGSFLTPQMDRLRHERLQNPNNHRAVEQFAARHRWSEGLYTINLLVFCI